MFNNFSSYDRYILEGSLGRHETFTPRYGWLKKGYEAIINKRDKEDNVFKASDAIERLGVGKNMVSSIRYWMLAFKLIESNNGTIQTTELADKLLNEEEGWDPYLEDVASLWLLHWQLFVPPLESVNWSFAFNNCNLWSFDINLMSRVIRYAAKKYEPLASKSDNTFQRDASCIIRMYSEDPTGKDSEINCPFTQLGIIQKAEEKNFYCFNTSEKQNLPALIFAAACFSYIDHYLSQTPKTVSIHKLTYDFNCPGVAFKVSESVVGSYLEAAAKKLQGFSIGDGPEGPQLYFDDDWNARTLYWNALKKYYEE
ncbi:DUF4007 family protein [Desulfolucanica intricata]|uniref:DUF4007 family protein n=1 Tax=Desulfolucanica intricata TaxID=1285191 RepID=UPI000831DF8E|nr:DUF4007 family protein [Desulfolucanica intricata]